MGTHVNWDKVFTGPNSIYTRPYNSEGKKEFTSEERYASRSWNTCAIGGSNPELGEKWRIEWSTTLGLKHPSELSHALEYLGLAFMNAVEDDNREIAHYLWNSIKLLTHMLKPKKKSVKKSTKKIIKD